MRSVPVRRTLNASTFASQRVIRNHSRRKYNSIDLRRCTCSCSASNTVTTSPSSPFPAFETRRSLSETPNHPLASSQCRLYSSSSNSDSHVSAPTPQQTPTSSYAILQLAELEDLDLLNESAIIDPDMPLLRPDFPDGLPALPHIRDNTIREQVFTHRSVYARTRHDFEDPPNDPAPDNEVYEFQGDAVLGLVITDLVRSCYPNLRVGPATKVKSSIVANANLADISVKYGLQNNLRLHRAQALALRSSVSNQADVFEAYIGGLYNDQGLEVVRNWLNELFLPYVKVAYRVCRDQHGLPSPPPSPTLPDASEDAKNNNGALEGSDQNQSASGPQPPTQGNNNNNVGYLSLFNQYCQQKRVELEWKWDAVQDEGTKVTPVWVAHAVIDGHQLSVGRGNTKKAAQNEAAREGLIQLGITNPQD